MAHDLPLGKIIEGEQHRDAIHIAVAPVVAAEKLAPGQDIGFVGSDTMRVGASAKALIGIVDPFLKGLVYPEQQFWMFLYPNTITSLRHDWTHPAFKPADGAIYANLREAAVRWMEYFAQQTNYSYDEVMEFANEAFANGYYVEQGSQSLQDAFRDPEEFWWNFEIITGKIVEDKDLYPFSCSC